VDYELTYADTIEEGAALAERIGRLAARGERQDIGFDTEFYGVNLGKESVVARAKVHFVSLAWLEGGEKFHPRGYTVPRAAVVSRNVALFCEPFRRVFQVPNLRFLAHNAPVDVHTLKNEGIEVINVANTLTRARWVYPGRARAQYGGGGYTLDALGKELLGWGKTETFDELFRERAEEWKETQRIWKECECGTPGCKRRVAGHTKHVRTETFREPVYVERPVPLQDVVPGHHLFDRAVRYAANDAVLAHCLNQHLTRVIKTQDRLVPWLPNLNSVRAS
jgi:hypothetical protein